MKILYLLSAFLFSLISLAAVDTVRITNASSFSEATGTTNTGLTLFAEAPTSEGITEATAAKVYIPMHKPGPVNNEFYYYRNVGSVNYNIFGYDSGANTYNGYFFNIPLTVITGDSKLYLYAAVKVGATYKVLSGYGTQLGNSASTTLNYPIYPQTICQAEASVTPNCSNFDTNGTTTEGTKEFPIYFFLSSASNLAGTMPDIGAPGADYPGGIFVNMKMDNTVYSATDLTVSVGNVRRGDRRILGTVTSTSQLSSDLFLRMRAYMTNSSISNCSSGPGNSCSFTSSSVISQFQGGDIVLAGLTNGLTYYFSVGMEDKYGFITDLSAISSAQPTSIEELLKKTHCYLLTAGFGEEHYVIDFFRHYRDHVLARSLLGQHFIGFYYKTAPRYAHYIAKSPFLQALVRGLAYLLYYVFQYFSLILEGILFIFFLKLFKFIKIKYRPTRI